VKSDIIINKTETIKRCIARIQEEYCGEYKNLENYTKQDSIILNIQRYCEACIDIANHVIRKGALGVPQSSRDSFTILAQHNIIPEELSERLQAMVGFRNVAVHDYQSINLRIVEKIIESYLKDGLELSDVILNIE